MRPPGAGPPRAPLFVERQTYRLRRLRDAARALPVFGLLLWCVPLLWNAPGAAPAASTVLIYLFATWLGLGLIAGLLSAALARAEARAAAAAHDTDTTARGPAP